MFEHITVVVVVVVIVVLVVFCSCFRHHNFILYYQFLLRNTPSAGYNTATVGLSPCLYYGRPSFLFNFVNSLPRFCFQTFENRLK